MPGRLVVLLAVLVATVACASFAASEPDANDRDSGALLGHETLDARTPDAAPVSEPDPYRDAVLADSPLAYFRFEETGGVTAKNEIPGSHVTLVPPVSGITFGVEGISKGRWALRLDARDAQVNVFGAMSFAGDAPFAVEAWIELTADADTSPKLIFTNMDDPSGSARAGQWMFVTSDGDLRTETWANGGVLFYALAPFPPRTVASWAHVVFVHSRTLDQDLLYVNTAAGEAGRTRAGGRVAPSAPLTWTGFTGRLDELAIYGTALDPVRIAAHYLAR